MKRGERPRKDSQESRKPSVRGDASVWKKLGQQFDVLANGELRGPKARPHDLLCGIAFQGVGNDSGRLVYSINNVPDKGFYDAFVRTATEAGLALGTREYPNAFENWLAFVFGLLRKEGSSLVDGVLPDGTGVTKQVCNASAHCCSKLVQEALEEAYKSGHSSRTGKRTNYRSSYKRAIREALLLLGFQASAQDVATWIADHVGSSDFPHISKKYGERQDVGQLYRGNKEFRGLFDRDVSEIRGSLTQD